MSSLFNHKKDTLCSPNKNVFRIKNKNKDGFKKVLLNVRSFKSPNAKSLSKRTKSTSKLFKEAHRVPSESTQETFLNEPSENGSMSPKSAVKDKLVSSSKTYRKGTLQEGSKKITLKKKLSAGNAIEKVVEVCINGESVKDSEQEGILDSLTRMILEGDKSDEEGSSGRVYEFLDDCTISEDSFELQIDSKLIEGNPQLQEWSQLMKRI